MYQTQRFVNVIASQLFGEYLYRMLALMTAIVFLALSNTSFALAPNPGATCEGIADVSQGSLTNADYSNLVSAVNTNNYVTIAGNAAGSIPLQIRMNTVESSTNTQLSNFGVITAGGLNAINIRRTFPNTTAFTDINLDFRNSITSQPIFLTNVALSAFDIDYANSNGNSFDDFIKITGINEAGATITGTFQQINNSNITSFDQGLRTTSTYNCPAKNLGTECQGSIQFSQPVASVRIRYTNTGRLSASPTNQEIDFRVDNYCYVPQYVFSGTVFDDNGGIPTAQADANQPNFTTGTYNNANYFNGVFNTPLESGIAGSTVRLVSCSNTSTIYATQPSGTGATIGKYQFSVPLSTFGTNRSICLIESRTGATYPVRTTSDNINTGFTTTTYNYPNRNFGRVITENAALVLRKFQFVNDCSTALNYNNIPTTSDPRTGFSTEGINGNIVPGQCIAYRITATNRANTPITNSVVQDRLQEKGQNGALVTSILANPVASTTDYASDSVPIGQNGLVKTNPFPLNQRTSRDFYFNTKYGTTNGNP
nr:hypothetical protein [uncultured Psychrobacter sp.]